MTACFYAIRGGLRFFFAAAARIRDSPEKTTQGPASGFADVLARWWLGGMDVVYRWRRDRDDGAPPSTGKGMEFANPPS
jgi:hypothetical protein